jgi:hypothetical protein
MYIPYRFWNCTFLLLPFPRNGITRSLAHPIAIGCRAKFGCNPEERTRYAIGRKMQLIEKNRALIKQKAKEGVYKSNGKAKRRC